MLGYFMQCLCIGFAAWVFATGVAVAQIPKAEYATKYERSFVGLKEKCADWDFHGPDAAKHVKFEPEGMRITLPAGYEGSRPQLGLATRVSIQGDFEITIRYEILQEPEPADAGTQTRLTLGAVLAQPRNNAATLSHRIMPQRGREYLAWLQLWDDNIGGPAKVVDTLAAQAKTGRLRMCRSGNTVLYYAAPGDGKDFQLVAKFPFSEDDVAEVRCVASTGGVKAALDARVTELTIRADAMPKAPMPPPPPKAVARFTPPTKEYAQEYVQSFKGLADRPNGWEFEGPDAQSCAFFEPAGLRLCVLAGASRGTAPKGVKTSFGVKGDCEITVTFEMIAEPPKEDAGAPVGTRFSLGIRKEEPRGDTSVARTLSSKSGLVFVGWSMVRKEGIEKPVQQSNNTPIKARIGRLRLLRSGPDVYYGGAEGADGEFIYFRKYPFGGDDLREIRLLVGTGSNKAMIDVRVTDFRIRADAIPSMAAAPLPGQPIAQAPPTPGKGGLFVVLIGGVAVTLLLAVGLGAVLLVRRGKAAPSDAAQPSTGAAGFVVCSECGKRLKVRPEFAGRKMKCPQCGNAVSVAREE